MHAQSKCVGRLTPPLSAGGAAKHIQKWMPNTLRSVASRCSSFSNTVSLVGCPATRSFRTKSTSVVRPVSVGMVAMTLPVNSCGRVRCVCVVWAVCVLCVVFFRAEKRADSCYTLGFHF